jgi:hypothetical protein
MVKLKFPILKNKMANHNCIHCKKKLKGNFVVFNAGSIAHDGSDGFCVLNVHFDKDTIYNSLSLVEGSPMGQFEFYSCSIKCMKKFFNSIFDEMEKRLKKF